MKILHDKYIEENEHFQISYSVFCRLRPFWTVAPTEKDRETCLCKICENGRYRTQATKHGITDLEVLIFFYILVMKNFHRIT
jgi:hypothetical protein